MNKLYIMLENAIIGMGGGQMYTRNKLLYMQQMGWKSLVFSGLLGKIVIDELKEFEEYIYPELASAPMVYNHKIVNNVLDKIISNIPKGEKVVIESGSAHLAYWGELLAERLRGKNMVHLLDERNDLTIPEDYLDFYWFKLNRRELSGINDTSLKLLFRRNKKITDENNYNLPSICQNVISEDDCDLKFPEVDFTVGCIGRLEKPYVVEVAHAYEKLIDNHLDKTFCIVFIGGSDSKQYEDRIKLIFNEKSNATVIMTGFLYPMPKKIFDKIDLFISSAGSAGVSYRQNRPTISVDSTDLKAIGVLGYTTKNSLNRKKEEPEDIFKLAEKVLFTDYLNEFNYKKSLHNPTLEGLKPHIDFLNSSSPEFTYYPIRKMHVAGIDKKKKILRKIFTTKGYVKLRPIFAKWIRKKSNNQ